MKPGRVLSPAFTLLEVVIAMGIFFMAIFAILELVSDNLRDVRRIKPDTIDASSLAAELMMTNRLVEGMTSGDLGKLYPGYAWTKEITLISTNGLFQVDFTLYRDGVPGDQMSVLMYKPDSGSSLRSTVRGLR